MSTLTDNRQLICRDNLNEVLATKNIQTDGVLRSIDTLLQPAFRMYASSTPDYTVYIGNENLANPVSSKNKGISPAIGGGKTNFGFAGASIAFTGSSATPTNGSAISFSMANDQYINVLVTANNGSLVLSAGTPGASASAATMPTHENGTGGSERVVGYVQLHKTGGTLDVIANSSIHQFDFPKYIPIGEIVGTSDSQTLTNKTFTDPVINGVASNLIPTTDANFELGSLGNRWKKLYVSDALRCDGTVLIGGTVSLKGTVEADGTVTTAVNIGTTTSTASVNIGTASTVTAINIGSATGAGTINVGTGSGNDLINIGTGDGTDTINMGTGPGIQLINIGTGLNTSTINIGGPSDIVTISGTLNVQTTNNTAIVDKMIDLNVGGAVGSYPSSGIQVNEADGSPISITAAAYQAGTFRVRLSTANIQNAVVGTFATVSGYTAGNIILNGTYLIGAVSAGAYIEVLNPNVTSAAYDNSASATATIPWQAASITTDTNKWNLSSGHNSEAMSIKTATSGRGMEIGRDAGGVNWMALNPDTTNNTAGALVPPDDGTTALGDSTRRFGTANVKGVNNTGVIVEKNYIVLDVTSDHIIAPAGYNDFLITVSDSSTDLRRINLNNLQIDGNVVQFVDIDGIFDTVNVALEGSASHFYESYSHYPLSSKFSVVRAKYYGGSINKWVVI